MKLLEAKILNDGQVLDNDILKVDSFLNHQIEPALIMAMGEDMAKHFANKGVTKVLTLEVSGIALALTTAFYLNVPLVYAKKTASVTLTDDVYTSVVKSFTKGITYDIKVDKKFLKASDKVLIVDDFLATGAALHGLQALCAQASCEVVGFGLAIEKVFQNGAAYFRNKGYDVYSQAMISSFKDGQVEFQR